MVRPMVHSTKHYVQNGISTIAAGVRESIRVVTAVESTVANTANEVAEGSSVKAIYFEMWLLNASNDSEFILTISKDPENGAGPSFAEHAALFSFTNKKNILYTTQGIAQNDGITGAIPVLRNWIKIPKSKQRFGLGDGINIVISNVSSGLLQRCGFATYKEYS